MRTSRTLRLLAPTAAAFLVIAACSDGSSESGPSATSTTTAPISDDVATATDTNAATADGIATGESDHEHEGGSDAIAWDGDEIPEIDVAVTGDPESGWDIAVTVTGFRFSSPAETDHVPGEGHTHVFVDGGLISMSYDPVLHVDDLEPGDHQAVVTLSRNDHTDYLLDGKLIMAMATFTVPGDIETADATITVMYVEGKVTGIEERPAVDLGDTVEITVQSDVENTVHVHGYDLFLELDADETDTIRFVADIPGIFEVEFEDGGALLFELEVS